MNTYYWNHHYIKISHNSVIHKSVLKLFVIQIYLPYPYLKIKESLNCHRRNLFSINDVNINTYTSQHAENTRLLNVQPQREHRYCTTSLKDSENIAQSVQKQYRGSRWPQVNGAFWTQQGGCTGTHGGCDRLHIYDLSVQARPTPNTERGDKHEVPSLIMELMVLGSCWKRKNKVHLRV